MASPATPPEPPLRAQLFSAEQMELHGQALARLHTVRVRKTPDRLLARLDKNENVLDDARLHLTQMVAQGVRITPAGEWLLDNYYLIEEQIRTARMHLPKGYSHELPRLDNGPPTPSSAWPRTGPSSSTRRRNASRTTWCLCLPTWCVRHRRCRNRSSPN